MLMQLDVFGKTKLENTIDRIKAFEPKNGEGYYLCFSGGKDSQCIYHLAKMAGVKFDAHYNLTSVDPPELFYFIRDNYPDVHIEIPHDKDGNRVSMWSLIAQNTIPPTRNARYCCEELKETGGKGRVTMTGVRWAESPNRKANQGAVTIIGKSKKTQKALTEIGASFTQTGKGGVVLNTDNDEARRAVEMCYRTRKTLVNPIIDWDDAEVWEFLNDIAKVPHCRLYDEGFTRLGCIGCPMSGAKGMKRGFARWPKYEALYIRAMEKMIENHPGQIRIATGEIARGGGRCSRLGESGVHSVAEMAQLVMDWWTADWH